MSVISREKFPPQLSETDTLPTRVETLDTTIKINNLTVLESGVSNVEHDFAEQEFGDQDCRTFNKKIHNNSHNTKSSTNNSNNSSTEALIDNKGFTIINNISTGFTPPTPTVGTRQTDRISRVTTSSDWSTSGIGPVDPTVMTSRAQPYINPSARSELKRTLSLY